MTKQGNDGMVDFWYQDGISFKKGSIPLLPSNHPHFESCYLFAFPKSGSVLVNDLIESLLLDLKLPLVNIASLLFSRGVSANSIVIDYYELFRPFGYCFTGFRRILPSMRGIVENMTGEKVLFVRDPRDMLVSNYYSLKFSHPFPMRGTSQFFSEIEAEKYSLKGSIDEFCIANAGWYNQLFYDYLELLKCKRVTVMRYEDVIFDKNKLALELCRIFSLDIPSSRVRDITAPFDVLPTHDIPNEHIRQVHPGDHKRKLQSATIEIINNLMVDFLSTFSYI